MSLNQKALESAIAMNDKLFAQQADIDRLKLLILQERTTALLLRDALVNCQTHLEMQKITDGFSLELEGYPFDPEAAIVQAEIAIQQFAAEHPLHSDALPFESQPGKAPVS